ncbi:MAG: HDIG domain-containing protein [Thermoplasmata archaeon]|nr:HDIG domain-containing protein [Thermoplasmata archaeon]
MDAIPTHEECIQILKDAGAPQELIDHAEAVAKLALEIAELIVETNHDLVEAGALLHDLGRIKSHGIDHGIIGGEMAKELELPESLQNIITNHIGAGLTEDDAKELGITPGNYIPQSIEEKIVAHADNLIDDTERIGIEEYIRKFIDEEQYKVARRVINLHNKLSELAGMDLDELTKS